MSTLSSAPLGQIPSAPNAAKPEPVAVGPSEPTTAHAAAHATVLAPAQTPLSKAHPAQPNNPLHGLSLEAILCALQAKLGWDGLARQIPLRCFVDRPSAVSSLKVLRKSPWARERLERLYLKHIR